MPYTIHDTGKPGPKRYEILKKETGRVVAHSASCVKARAYTRMAHRGEKSLPAMSVVDSTAGGSFVGPPAFATGTPRRRRKLRLRTKDYSASERRDSDGKFSSSGGGGHSAAKKEGGAPAEAHHELAATVHEKLSGDIKKMTETPEGKATLARGQALAQKVRGGIQAGVKAVLDGLDKESRGGISLIAGGHVAAGSAQILQSVFTCVHEEVFEAALSQHSIPGAHAVGMVAATVAAKAEQGLLKAVSWAWGKATGAKDIDGVLWTKSGELTDADRELLAQLARVAADAVREVLAAAGVPDAEIDEQAMAARIAELLQGGHAERDTKSAPATGRRTLRFKAGRGVAGKTLASTPMIELPDVVQDEGSCGAALAMSVGRFFGVGPDDLAGWKQLLGTTPEEGTSPVAILRVLGELGLAVEERQEMTLDDLRRCWQEGKPVLCPIQDYGSEADSQREENGHWVGVVGVDHGYVFVQDPLATAELEGTGSDAAPGRVMIHEQRWLEVWYDRSADGTEYRRYGIIVGPAAQPSAQPAAKSLEPVLSLPEVLDVLRGKSCQLDKDLHGANAFGLDSPAVGETRFDDSAMAISFIFAASQGRDRVGDFLEVEGIWTGKHQKNPVAYLDHGKWCRWPIGKDVDPAGNYTVVIDGEAGLASCTTYLSQSLPEAVQAYQLYREGILKAGSIGYRPMQAKKLPPDPSLLLPAGLHLLEVELIETTLTGLPMNGDCARKALEMRLDGGRVLLPALRAMIEPHADPRKVWAHGSNLTPQGKAAMKTKDIQPTTPGDPAAAPTPATPDPAVAPETDPNIPHGAQTLGDIYQALESACQVIEDESERLDNAAVKKFLDKFVPSVEKVMADLAAAFAKEYPDLEPLQDEAAPEGGKDDEDEEEGKDDEDEEETKNYRPRHKGLRRKGAAGAVRAPAVPVQGKALTKSDRVVVGKAAEFLDEHKDADNLSYDQKILAGHHAEALKSIAGGASGDDDGMSEEEKALVLGVLGRIEDRTSQMETKVNKMLPKP